MRLLSLSAKNFRSYKDGLQLDFHKPITVFIGRNNAGKSNILEFLRWVRDMALGTSGASSDKTHTGAGPSAILDGNVALELDQAERNELLGLFGFPDEGVRSALTDSQFLREIQLNFRIQANGILSERVDISNVNDGWFPILEQSRRDPSSIVIRAIDLQEPIRQFSTRTNITIALKDVATISSIPNSILNFGPGLTYQMVQFRNLLVSYFRKWVPIAPQRRPSDNTALGQDYTVNPSGENLARVLNTIQIDSPPLFAQIVSEIQKLIPDILQITAPPRGSQVTIRVQEPGGVDVTLGNVSDGLRQSLLLAGTLLTSKASIVMIEEPELGMHASAQRQLLEMMRKLVALDQRIQFVVTTHSTIFARDDNQIETNLVTKKNGVSSVHHLESKDLHFLKNELGHENTDLFGWNALVITEGQSEEVAMPIFAENLGIDLQSIGIRIHNVRGSSRALKIEHLLRYLKDSDTCPYLILDAHGSIKEYADRWSSEGLISKVHVFISSPEFEDSFDNQTILDALSRYETAENIKLSLNENDLNTVRREKKPIAKFIQQKIFATAQQNLDKPLLAELLAEAAIQRKAVPQEIANMLNEIIKSNREKPSVKLLSFPQN